MDDFTEKKSFCVAPWIHYYRSPTGQRGFCCFADPLKEDNSQKSFEETQNSPAFKEARKKMMNGELPKECHLCVNANMNRPYKDDLNYYFWYRLPEIFQKTEKDGSTTVEPRYLDFRFLTCNLTCLTCNSGFSSKWRQVMREIDPEKAPPILPADFAQREYKRVLQTYQWDRVYYAGGEPTLVPGHLEDLDILLEQERRQQENKKWFRMSIYYNTNLQQKPEFLEAWIDRLNQFKSPSICVSLDGVGRFNELVRVGSSFEQTEQNLFLLKRKLAPHVIIKLNVVITSVLVASLHPFVDWLLQQRFPIETMMMIGGTMGKILRIENLKLSFRQEVLRSWKGRFADLSESDQELLQDLDQLLTAQLLAPEFSPEEKRENLALLEKTPFEAIKKEIKELLIPLM